MFLTQPLKSVWAFFLISQIVIHENVNLPAILKCYKDNWWFMWQRYESSLDGMKYDCAMIRESDWGMRNDLNIDPYDTDIVFICSDFTPWQISLFWRYCYLIIHEMNPISIICYCTKLKVINYSYLLILLTWKWAEKCVKKQAITNTIQFRIFLKNILVKYLLFFCQLKNENDVKSFIMMNLIWPKSWTQA